MEERSDRDLISQLVHGDLADEDAADLVETQGLTEDEQDAIASLTGTAGHRAILRVYRRRAEAMLATMEREEDEAKFTRTGRLWQALRMVAEDLEFYPDTCRKSLAYNKDKGAEAQEDDE